MERKEAKKILKTIKASLALCGVKTKWNNSEGVLCITGELWNSINGNMETFSIGGIENDGYELEAAVQPTTDCEILLDKMGNW